MKRALYLALLVFIVAAMTLCFVACGGEEESEKPTGSTNGGSTTESSTPTTESKPTTDSSNPTTDSSNPTTDSSNPTTDSSVPTTDSSVPTTDSSDPTTESSDPTTDSSKQDPPVDEHEHTYSDVYSYDSNNHFYKATCEHTDEVTGTEPHSYDEAGNCKCGHHVHVYSTEYSYDAQNHFYKATCEHTEEISGLEAHSYDDEGKCKCGRVKDFVQEVIAGIIANEGSVTGGTSEQVNNNIEYNAVSTTKISYKFYENYVYVKEEGEYINEYYYSYDNDKLVAILVQNGTKVTVDSEASADNLEGAKYNFGCIGDYETYVCGAEKLIEYFYNYGVENASDSYVIEKDGNTYSVRYGVRIVDDWMNYYYYVNVSFTVDEATGSLASTSIVVDRYAQESYTLVDGECVLNEDATANYQTTFTITQSTQANDNVENPYDSGKILLDSLSVKDKNGNNIEETIIKARANEEIKIYFRDIAPSTALLELSNIEIIVENEADATQISINPYFNSYDNYYSFFINIPGTYVLLVYVDDITFTSTIEVAPKVPVSISSQVYNVELGEFNQTKKAEVYAGSPLYFMSYVDSGYDGAYTAELVENVDEAIATITSGALNGKDVSVFNSGTVGTYMIKITSTADPSISCQLQVNVVEAPKVEDVLVGDFIAKDEYGNVVLNATFDQDSSTAVITYVSSYGEEYTELSYSVVDGVISFECVDGDEFVEQFYVTDQFQIVMVIYEEEFVLEQVVVEKELVASGTLDVEDIAGNGAKSGEYAFEYYSNGEFVFYKTYSATKEISLVQKNEGYLFKFAGGELQALTKISGEADTLAGKYATDGVVSLVIALDEVATPVTEPTYGTIAVDHVLVGSSGIDYDFVYGYEIIDGEFVIYRYGEVTDEAILIDLGTEYSFKYPGITNSQKLEKVEGEDDVLMGEYIITMNLGQIIRIANVTITSGAAAPQKPVIVEPAYGTIILEDENGGELSGTYTYEIINGAFVIYKDGVVTTDFAIIDNNDDTYSFQCDALSASMILDKESGQEFALAGSYGVYSETTRLYEVTFVPGLIDEEEATGTLVIEDNNTGALSGTYFYKLENGVFVFYKEDGTAITDEFYITIGLDGTSYSFQCTDMMVPQTLVKVEGMNILVGGKYNVNGETEGVYVFTFKPGKVEKPPVYVENGTLEVVDNNQATVGGSYTYSITDEGEIVIFKDGEITTDIIISVGVDGNYTFQCEGLTLPQTLVKLKGEAGRLSGKYQIFTGANVKYVVTFTTGDEDWGNEEVPVVIVGTNNIEVADESVTVIFKSFETGQYMISFVSGEENGVIAYRRSGESEFTPMEETTLRLLISQGEIVELLVSTLDGQADTISFTITMLSNSSGDVTTPDEEL